MTKQHEKASIPIGRVWRRRCLWGSVVALVGGIPGLLFVLTKDDAFVIDHVSRLEFFAGAVAAGAIALFGVSFWQGITQRPALIGGLLSGALLSLALILSKAGWVFLLMVPVGGAVAARIAQVSSTEKTPMPRRPKIGAQSGLIATLVAFAFGLPLALVVGNAINMRFAHHVASALPDVVASGVLNEPPRPSGSTFASWLLLSVLAIALSWLGGFFGAGRVQRSEPAN